MAKGTPVLRGFDDETLLDMYDHAHDTSDAHCDAIAAELIWRGIAVKPCGRVHAPSDDATSTAAAAEDRH